MMPCMRRVVLACASIVFFRGTCVAGTGSRTRRRFEDERASNLRRKSGLDHVEQILLRRSRLGSIGGASGERQAKLSLSRKTKQGPLPYIYVALWPGPMVRVCLMVFLTQALGTRALYGVSRFVDEACCSRLTQALATVYGNSMRLVAMIVYILGYHFYLAASSDGKLQPPSWVEFCVLSIVIGIEVRVLATLLLTLLRDPSRVRHLPMGHRMPLGEPVDVYKTAKMYKYQNPWIPHFCFIMSGVAEVIFTLGVIGIFIAICGVPLNTDRVAPSLLCAVALCVSYIVASYFIECVRTLWAVLDSSSELVEEISGVDLDGAIEKTASAAWSSNWLTKIEQALLAATATSQKAVALSIIYLFTWVRQLRTHPPYGLPTPQMRLVALVTTGALLAEVAMSVGVGATIAEGVHNHFGTVAKNVYGRIWLGLTHGIGGIAVLGVVPTLVRFSHNLPDWGHGRSAMLCALWNGAFYYFVHGMQMIVTTIDACFDRKRSPSVQAALLSAVDRVRVLPVFALLFAMCWSRAFFITDGNGCPQGWATELMTGATIAKTLQVLSGLFGAVVAGGRTKDADGNTLDSQRPSVAYILTFLDAITFTYEQIGTFGVLVSLLIMTPETAMNKVDIGTRIGLIIGISVLAIFASLGKMIGLTVKVMFNSFTGDSEAIQLNSFCVSVPLGYVCIEDLVIPNPVDLAPDCRSPCILSMDLLHLKVGVLPLIRSFGKTLAVETVVLHGFDLYYEVPSGHGKSNIWSLVAAFREHAKGMNNPESTRGQETKNQSARSQETNSQYPQNPQDTGDTADKPLTLFTPDVMSIQDVHVSINIWNRAERITMDDIDVNIKRDMKIMTGEHVSESGTSAGKAEIVKIAGGVLMWIMQSIVKHATQQASAAVQTVPCCAAFCGRGEALKKKEISVGEEFEEVDHASLKIGRVIGARLQDVGKHLKKTGKQAAEVLK